MAVHAPITPATTAPTLMEQAVSLQVAADHITTLTSAIEMAIEAHRKGVEKYGSPVCRLATGEIDLADRLLSLVGDMASRVLDIGGAIEVSEMQRRKEAA